VGWKHLPRDRDVGHVRGGVAATAHDLAPILITFPRKLVSKPTRRQRQRPQEIAEVVGEGTELKANRV
jgi:hypothetical protein